jgi:hypothetical protein
VTSARGTSGGQIIALSGMTDGVTNVAGTMDVSATAGDGGFIETSAARVNVADSALIKASGGVGGKGGTWLIDPADFYIDDTAYGGNISGATLSANLNAGTTVMIDSDLGTAGYGGSIFVNEAVSWSSAGGLTLIARNDVVVNSAITNGGTGDVKLYAGWDGGSTSIPVVGTTGVIDLHAAVSTGGNVHLIAGGDIIQDLSSPISAAGLLAISNAGSVSLDLASNSVGTIAGKAVTNFKFKNAPSLTVDTVGGVSGITVENPSGNAYAKLELAGSGSSHLYVNKDIRATGGSNGGNAEIYLNAVAAYGGNIFVTDATVSAIGGTSSSSYGGTATVNVYASGGDLTISGSQVLATGGVGASEYQDGNANINLTAYSGGIGITDSSALIATGYEANVDLNAYSFASVTLANSSIQAAGKASADGGEGNVSIYSSNGSINAGSGTISATGNTNSYYKDSEVNLSGLSGVTLGSVTATHYVSVYSANGAIVVGNTGLNISAPEVYLNGYSGVGSIANPLETLATELRVSSGNGDIGIINTGNLWLYAYDAVYAPSGNAAIETTGILTVDGAEGYAGGDLSLLANGDINITGYYGSVRASGNLLLQAGGNLNIGGAGGYYNYAYGYSNTVAVAGGNLNVLSGDLYGSSNSILGTSSNTTVTTGGNVVVDRSTIYGYPEVNMQVGGTVSINGVFGNSGRIEAGSPSTINVEFTKLTGGGYSVNGVDGAIYDALTNSGFVVLGDPAVLGATMMVTYSGVAATISPPTETLIVAMNQAITPPEKEQSTGAIESEDEKNKDKKKDLPICGK